MLLGIWSEAATGPERYLGVDGMVYYSEALEVGCRSYQAQGITPLCSFGFGLSYTTFTLDVHPGAYRMLPGTSSADTPLEAQVTVE